MAVRVQVPLRVQHPFVGKTAKGCSFYRCFRTFFRIMLVEKSDLCRFFFLYAVSFKDCLYICRIIIKTVKLLQYFKSFFIN